MEGLRWSALLLACGACLVGGQLVVAPERGAETRSLPCGGGISLSMVIDTTSSMKKPLRAIKKHVERMVGSLRKTPGHHVHNYVAVPLNEPVPTHSIKTTNPTEFTDYINSFVAFGGGDCKEHMLAALVKASDLSCPNSTIYVASDASPKDVDLLGTVLERLQEKEQHVIFLLTGRCGDENSASQNALKTIATTSGGQTFWLFTGFVGPVLNYMRMTYKAQPHVLLAWRLHTPPPKETSTLMMSVPVDSSLESISAYVTCTSGNPTASLRPPRGAVAAVGSRQWTKNLGNTVMALVEKPPVGSWTVTVSSESECMVRVLGASNVNLRTVFRLAEPNAPRAREGSTEPDAGRPQAVEAEVDGGAPPQSGRPTLGEGMNLIIETTNLRRLDRVQLVGVNGSELAAITFNEPTLYNNQGVVHAGPLTVPAENFYLIYTGQYQGAAVVRYSTTAIWPKAPSTGVVTNPGQPVARAHVCGALRAECRITGHDGLPVPSVWTRGQEMLAPSNRISLLGESTSLLEINPVHKSDQGMYTCTPARPSGRLTPGYLQVVVEGSGNGPCMPAERQVWNSRQCLFVRCTLPVSDLRSGAVAWQHNTQQLTHDGRNVFIYANGTLVVCSSNLDGGEGAAMTGEFSCRGLAQSTGEELIRTAVVRPPGSGRAEDAERPSVVHHDACARGTHECNNHARCIPTLRNYLCQCHQGFTGNGRQCSAISCPMPSNPRHGNVMISGGLGIGARITYSCHASYEMSGERQLTCQSSGQWSGAQVQCTKIRQATQRPTTSDDLPSYIRILPASPEMEVDSNGCRVLRCAVEGRTNPNTMWTQHNRKLVMSSNTQKLADGSLKLCPFNRLAHAGEYGCLARNAEGQMAMRSFTVSASDQSIPSPTVPSAEITPASTTVRECPILVGPTNGRVTVSKGTMAGSIADYRCETGYLLSGGDASRQCDGSSMRWTGQAPACQEVQEEPTQAAIITGIEKTSSSSACVKLVCSVANPAFKNSLTWTHYRTEDAGPSMSTTFATKVYTHDKYMVTLEDRALHICDGDRREAGQYCCLVNLAGQRYTQCIQLTLNDVQSPSGGSQSRSCPASLNQCQNEKRECLSALEGVMNPRRGGN